MLLAVVLFCSVIPICKEYSVNSRTATGADGKIIEVDYYGKDGKVYKNEKYNEGEVISVTENTYNKNGIDEVKISYFGTLFQTIKHEYDGKNLLRKLTIDNQGVTETTENYFYDESGVLINSVLCDETGAQKFRYDYTYEDGNLVKKALYDVEYDYTRVTTYTYEKGKLVSETTVAGAYHNKTLEYSYNSKGLLSMQSGSSQEDYISYTYEYNTKRVSIFGKIF